MDDILLYLGDCLDVMKIIPDGSIDMVLCDLPYSRTHNRWDIKIPFDKLWENYERVAKENCAILLFSDGMFMADLMESNKKTWKYNLIWDKVLTSGFLNANRQPLRQHEEICVFYHKQPTYNPQKVKGSFNHGKGKEKVNSNNNYNAYKFIDNRDTLGNMKHPKSILSFSKDHPSVSVHPTQKPVSLLEYLIRTYTNEGETVLDNCMGSGSTGVACVNTGRKFIGIELDEKYYEIAEQRILEAKGRIENDATCN